MTKSKDDGLERLRNLVARLEAVKPIRQVNYNRMPDGIVEIEDFEKVPRYISHREGEDIDRFGE